jgi:hypothetical protein
MYCETCIKGVSHRLDALIAVQQVAIDAEVKRSREYARDAKDMKRIREQRKKESEDALAKEDARVKKDVQKAKRELSKMGFAVSGLAKKKVQQTDNGNDEETEGS